MKPMDDIARLKDEYEDRKHRFVNRDVYSWFNQGNLFALYQRQRALLKALRKIGIADLSDLMICEMGCGGGGVLTEFLNYGAMPKKLFGIDLLIDRLAEAQLKLPATNFVNANGQNFPFASRSFDFVLQYTALSSILDSRLRVEIARDMLRIVKPGGVIISYDFWINPTNAQTRGIPPSEIRGLFQNCTFEFHKITLAPPIARRLVPISWGLAWLLESFRVFNTHYLIMIFPKNESKL